ncbi:MAG: hypothetical protein ABJC74_04125 [Gemmatimonadota bacterium]
MPLFLVLPAIVIGLALVVWLLRPQRQVQPEAWEAEDQIEPVDQAELDAAEREVRGKGNDPEEEDPGDDWGPGSSKHIR